MILYLLVALWPLVMEKIYTQRRLKFRGMLFSKEFHVFLALLPVFVMIGFRGNEMGADTGVYLRHFTNTINTPLSQAIASSRMEVGYILFVKLIGTFITQEPLVYQLICTVIYFIGIFSFIKQQEEKDGFLFIYFFITLGLFTFMFTGVRQCLAMSICLFSYKFIRQRKLMKFVVCVVLAYCFHKSAILFLTVYFISRRKITLYNVVLYGGLVYLSIIYLQSIQEWFNEQLEYDYAIESTGSGGVFLLVLLFLTILSFVSLYPQRDMCENARMLMNVNFITLFFWILRIRTRVAERPSFYFLFFSCALAACGLNRIKDSKKRVLFKFLVIGCTLLLFYYRMRTNFASFVPYEFY